MDNLLNDFERILKNFQQRPKSEFAIYTGGYGMAVLKGDAKLINEYKRKFRVDKIRKFKKLLTDYGKGAAYAIAVLDEKCTPSPYILNNWSYYSSDLSYMGFPDDDMGVVYLRITMINIEEFVIDVRVTIDISLTIIEKQLSTCSYRSVLNQLN
jgi:hypothetical protein